MKIGICDDNQQDREALKAALLPVLQDYEELECFGHGMELLESHDKQPFDILFLDIGMPHINGVEVARELRHTCQSTHIIFVTQYRDYAAESYTLKAFSYLNKPFEEEHIRRIFQEAQQSRLAFGKQLVLSINHETIFVQISSIIYAETLRNKLRLHTHTESFDIRMTMQELVTQLEGYGFYRLHNSYLVNLACIRTIKQRSVLIDGDVQIPIGKTKRVSEVKRAVLSWRGWQV